MTVKELKEKLNEYPDSMDVFLDERLTKFSFGLLNGIREQKISLYDNITSFEDVADKNTEVVILSED